MHGGPAFLRRSTLILPVNVPRFVEKAHLRDADAVMLDLEDSVPEREKAAARRRIPEAATPGGAGRGRGLRPGEQRPPPAPGRRGRGGVSRGRRPLPAQGGVGGSSSRAWMASWTRWSGSAASRPGRLEVTLIVETTRGLLALPSSSPRPAGASAP